MSALSFGDAIAVAVAGGVGTLIGGAITAAITYRTKLLEFRFSEQFEKNAARRRQGERQAEISQQLLSALADLDATVWATHSARLTDSKINLPSMAAMHEFRLQAGKCKLLSSRIVDSDIRRDVRDAIERCECLLTVRELAQAEEEKVKAEACFDLLTANLAIAISRFEEQAV
jgi:hypothetical protein